MHLVGLNPPLPLSVCSDIWLLRPDLYSLHEAIIYVLIVNNDANARANGANEFEFSGWFTAHHFSNTQFVYLVIFDPHSWVLKSSAVSFHECYFGETSVLSSKKCECKWRPDSPTRRSTLQTPTTAPSVWGWPWPRSRRGTWEINWAGLLTQQVSRLSSTHPGPICQLASCSTEPWQQGTAGPARLHYACQMGWELDSNSHHGGGRGSEEREREMEEEESRWGRKCVRGRK